MTEELTEEQRYVRMFDLTRAFGIARQEQRSRGLNDFNVFTTLLDASDEVRLHSRFIAELLDPNGTHGQGALFLRSFMDLLCVDAALGTDVEKYRVFREYAASGGERIDIYLTDGRRHIVVENKIWAADQEEQIKRYVEAITRDDDRSIWQEKVVVYLSPSGQDPSEYSLGEYRIVSCEDGRAVGWVVGQDEVMLCQFRAISYDNHIRPWILKALAEVSNITNLNVALDGYLDVIEKLYGRYEEKTMNFATFMKQEGRWSVEYLKDLKAIVDEFECTRFDLIKDVLSQTAEILKNRQEMAGWQVSFVPDELQTKWQGVVRLFKENASKEFGLMLVFDKDKAKDAYFSAGYFNYPTELKDELTRKKKDLQEEISELISSTDGRHLRASDSASLCWRWMKSHPDDLFELALDKGGDGSSWELAKEVAADFVDFFKSASPIVGKFLRLT